MEIQPGYSELPQPELSGRRDFLRRASLIGLASAAVAALGGTRSAQAAELGLNVVASLNVESGTSMAANMGVDPAAAEAEESYWSWEWWPKRAGIVNDAGVTLRTLHQKNVGPLAVHDSETGKHAMQWEENLVNWIHDNYPDADTWAGGCYAKTSAIILEDKPIDVIGEGLLVAKHAGDLMIPVERNLIIPRYIGSRRIAVESPKYWWSVADRAIGADSVERTNFGFSRRVTSVGAVVSAYIPYYFSDPAELSGGLVQFLELESNQLNLRLKNPELDIDFVNFRAYHR